MPLILCFSQNIFGRSHISTFCSQLVTFTCYSLVLTFCGRSVSQDLCQLEEITSVICWLMCFGSAGIGRTGTIVVIDMLIDTIDAKGEFISLCIEVLRFSYFHYEQKKTAFCEALKSQQPAIWKLAGSVPSWSKILAIVPFRKALKTLRDCPGNTFMVPFFGSVTWKVIGSIPRELMNWLN